MQNSKPHILIVDDEKGLRVGTQRLLESEGYIVQSAENGLTGIKYGTEREFDLAIIDLKMPDVDGLEVLQKIKKVFPFTVCFIATAFASYDTAIEATRIGAYGYIPKPFTPEELIYQIEKGYKHRKLLLESDRLKKEKEESLLEIASEKSRLKTILESISDGVLVVNKSGEVVYYNNASLKLLGFDEIKIGQQILGNLPEEINEKINRYLKPDSVVNKSRTVQIELNHNSQVFIEAVCSPVLHTDGSFAGVVIVLKNITEFKKIEFIKNQFVSMVAHELKAPVAAVSGFIKLILDKSFNISNEQQEDYLRRSGARLNGLLDLVNDLLDISRMETKTKQREIEDLDIKEIILNTLQFLEIDIKNKNIKVDINFEDNIPSLKADQNEITRLFTNIFSNAIKYNRTDGSIKVSLSIDKNYLKIKISDTGIGMRPEDKDRLFNEFFRAKNKFTQNIGGTGLGLSIVKRIIDSYYGKIDVESEYNVGSTFTIYLPNILPQAGELTTNYVGVQNVTNRNY